MSATSPNTGLIVGVVVGVVVGLLLLAGACYRSVRHSRSIKKRQADGQGNSGHDYSAAYLGEAEAGAGAGAEVQTWADVETDRAGVDASGVELQDDAKGNTATIAIIASSTASATLAASILPLSPTPTPTPTPITAAEPARTLPVDPWVEGLATVASATGDAAQAAAEALLPGILSLAREFPLLGPFAGVLLQFYRVYKTMGANAAAYSDLKEQVDLGADWIREIAPQLKSKAISSALVEQALRRVVNAVYHSTQLIAALTRRYEDARARGMAFRIANALASTVLSSQDRDKLTKALTWLKEVISYLLQTIPTVTGLQVKAKLESVAEDVGSIMALLSGKEHAQERLKKLQELQLQSSEIRLVNMIGEGGFSVVYTGNYHRKQVAVKVVKRKDGNKLNAMEKEAIENELLITRLLADPNILTCYGFCHELNRTLVVLEFAPYGSLWEMLYDEATFPSPQAGTWSIFGGSSGGSGGTGSRSHSGGPFPLALCIGWLKDLCSAAAHLYARGVKHKDIKAENLLVYSYPDRLVVKVPLNPDLN